MVPVEGLEPPRRETLVSKTSAAAVTPYRVSYKKECRVEFESTLGFRRGIKNPVPSTARPPAHIFLFW